MPRLGLGLGTQISASSAYDADAASYFARAGVTDATAKAQINAFVKGVKGLGIWNSMACWPLRSSQNAGTGTTVYSLGGAGTFNGTFGGSPNPTWTKSGVQSSGANNEAKINIPSAITSLTSAGCTIYGVTSKGVCDNYGLFLTEVGGTSAYPSILLNFVNSTGVVSFATRNSTRYFQSLRGGAFPDGFSSSAAVFRSTSQANFRNATLISNDTGLGALNLTGPVDLYAIAQAGNVSNNPGVVCSFVLVTSTTLSDANITTLNSLYNSTLGANLYDSDAETYFTTAGITDTTAKQQISDFVAGVKGLGLWNNMVCWPLRSAQNAGTGTTAYSLGGLGTYNGTLTNGPTWGTDGVIFDGSNDYISASTSISTNNTGTIFYCGIHATMTGDQKAVNINRIEIGKAESASFGIEGTQVNPPFPTIARGVQISGFGSGVRYTATGVYIPSSTTMIRFYNGASKETNGAAVYGTFSTDVVLIGSRATANNFFNGTISVAVYFNSALSDSNVSSLHTLYKTTLGTGLGLP